MLNSFTGKTEQKFISVHNKYQDYIGVLNVSISVIMLPSLFICLSTVGLNDRERGILLYVYA